MKIYEHDGFIGYFRGLTPRIMRKGLGNILAWGIYEYLVDKRAGVYIDWINVLINKVFNDDAILRKLLIIYYSFTDVIKSNNSSSTNIRRWLGDVTDPSVRVVILLGWSNFQVLHLKVRHIVHRNFKVHWYRADLLPAFCRCRCFQRYLHYDCMLKTSLELFDRPFSQLLLWFILCNVPLYSFGYFKRYSRCLFRHWELHNNLSGEMIRRECRSHFESKLEFVLR